MPDITAMKVWIDSIAAYSGAKVLNGKNHEQSIESAASVIEAALQKARDEERAAVVAWLRSSAESMDYDFGPGMEISAEVIERGEHRREG